MKNMIKIRTAGAFLLLLTLVLPNVLFAQQAVPAEDINAKIRKEGTENSKIMNSLHHLTDIYGPRLTGSPNLKAAGEWIVKEMTSWGFENAALEPWDWGRPGWVSERSSGFIVSPVKDSLVFEVLAWTPGTDKVVTGQAVQLNLPSNPTQEELTAYLNSVQNKIAGNMVLVGPASKIPVSFEAPAKRINPNPTPTPTPRAVATPPSQPTPRPGALNFREVAEQLNAFLVTNKAAVRIMDAGREHGQIRAFGNSTYDGTKVVPTVVMRNEDYGRISRILAGGTPVTLEFDIRNKFFPEGSTDYNVVAELPGTDKKDEVVMLGGHLDSWHAATGATDNAIGVSVMMEAARILKAIGVKPRRTIRVAFWSGEEQGLNGSQAYVAKHFGTFEKPTPNYDKFAGYFNIDMGTGQARRFIVFGPQQGADILKAAGEPFADLGFIGATTTPSRRLGGSDHTSFNQAGLPGISVQQDPIEYFTHTWHTNLDTYERIIEDDVKKSAIIVAAAVYQLAMRDEKLPRFSASEMPAPPNEAN